MEFLQEYLMNDTAFKKADLEDLTCLHDSFLHSFVTLASTGLPIVIQLGGRHMLPFLIFFFFPSS